MPIANILHCMHIQSKVYQIFKNTLYIHKKYTFFKTFSKVCFLFNLHEIKNYQKQNIVQGSSSILIVYKYFTSYSLQVFYFL